MSRAINKVRAARIPLTLAAYRKAQSPYNVPDEADIRDMLTDLMHYCQKQGINFKDELRVATNNYEEEAK
jgi:hypothetical protein